MRHISHLFALLVALFTTVGTQTAAAQATVPTNKWYKIKCNSMADNRLTPATSTSDQVAANKVTEGTDLYYIQGANDDATLFRFVQIEEFKGMPIYGIQHKTTGMYINEQGYLSKAPSRFINVGNSTSPVILLVDENGTPLSGFGCSMDPSTRDRLAFNDGPTDFGVVDDVAPNYKPAPIVVSGKPGKISFQCWPVELSCENGMYKVVAFIEVLEGNSPHYLAIKKITTANAGEPFLYIHGVGQVWNKETVDAEFQIGNGVSMTPKYANGMIGVFAKTTLYSGQNYGAMHENGRLTWLTQVSVNPYSAYAAAKNLYAYDSSFDYIMDGNHSETTLDYDLLLELNAESSIPTAINKTLQKAGKAGNVYDMSGRQVATGATLDDVKRLRAGTYILNGVKVSVK